MTDRDHKRDHDERPTGADEEPARPKQYAARHRLGGEDDKSPQGRTGSTRWDTEEHSDAPGPFGTG